MSRFDASGLFWNEPVRVRATAKSDAPRQLPPVPDTGWTLPEGIDAYPDLSEHGMIAIDVEANDPDLTESGPGHVKGTAYVCGIAVGTERGFRQYYPIRHEMGPNLPTPYVVKWLSRELSRKNQPKVGANLIYDLEALHCLGVEVEGPFYDVQVAAPLLDETKLSYALEVLAQEWVGEGKTQSIMLKWLKTAFGDKEANIKKHIHRAPATIVGPYAESDVDLPLRMFALMRQQLEAQGLWDLFILESKLIPMLLAMRLRGVPVDVPHAERLMDELNTSFNDRIAQIKHTTGIGVDVWAADSLAKVFDKEGIPYPRTPKTGAPSFRKEWLGQQTHPVARMILDARHMDKFRGTFVQGYILDGHVNGRIHGQFHQLRSDEGGTVSGRFSSSGPNLQNIPVRTAEGTRIREAFIADKGLEWWSLDWSQIEYRLIVHYASITKQPGIEDIVNRYINDPNVDYHQAVAELTGLSRSNAKNLNFGLAYGQGIDLLCANLGVDREEGMRIMTEYHKRAPFIRPLANAVSNQAAAVGYIKTLLGRRRRFNVWERKQGKGMPEYCQESNLGHFSHLLTEEQLRRHGWIDRDINDFQDQDEHAFARVPTNPAYLRLIKNYGWRRAFGHKSLNALIQGGAADIMKAAMVQCWEAGVFDPSVLGAPYLTVHDELDGPIETGNKVQEEAFLHVKHVMETVIKFRVPLSADGSRGTNWAAAKGK